MQSRRNTRAAQCLVRKLMDRRTRPPRVMITDKLASYGAAKRRVMPSVEQRKHRGLNSRAENFHQYTRRRERQMQRFKISGQAKCFFSAHYGISNLFHLRRHQVRAAQYRAAWTQAFQVWAEITGVAPGAQLRAHHPYRSPSRPQSNKLMVPLGGPDRLLTVVFTAALNQLPKGLTADKGIAIASRFCGVAIQDCTPGPCRRRLPRRSRLAMTGASWNQQGRTSGGWYEAATPFQW